MNENFDEFEHPEYDDHIIDVGDGYDIDYHEFDIDIVIGEIL